MRTRVDEKGICAPASPSRASALAALAPAQARGLRAPAHWRAAVQAPRSTVESVIQQARPPGGVDPHHHEGARRGGMLAMRLEPGAGRATQA